MKILVADDSMFYRNMLQGFLESWGYEVVLAVDGYDAERILDGDEAPRLAILDCLMPGLSGLELCERIRARKQGYVYAILLSADNQESDVVRGFEFGADDYLCKPFNQFELRTRLKVGELIIRSHEEVADAHDALKFEASHDFLLRTWNRRTIIELLGKELSRAKRSQTSLSVLLADLDCFKRVNDSYGNLVGDEVLRSAAEGMAAAVRNEDHVGRYEGEEFLVVLPNCASEAAREVAERVRQSIGNASFQNGVEITVSVGVSQWRSGQEIHNLLHRAEVALYRAKQNGRNCVEVENATDADRV
jgi:two-component system, cell cycle response regulator